MKFYSIAPETLEYSIEIGNKAKNLMHVTKLLGQKAIVRGFVIPTNCLLTEKRDLIASEIVIECEKRNILFPVILRSSANVEDSIYSFAGIFESYVCNTPNDVLKGLNVVCNAMEKERLRVYCEKNRINVGTIKLAIILQQFVHVDYSGVAFSKHPITNDNNVIFVEYLPKDTDGVESGRKNPLEYYIKKNLIPTVHKDNSIFCQLANVVVRLESYFDKPIDVEWAFENGRLLIFQVRPITTQ